MVLWDAEHLFKLLHLLSTRHRELQPLLPLFRAPYAERLLQELTRAAREPDIHAASMSLRRWLEHQASQLRIPAISDAVWGLWLRQLTPSGGSALRQRGFAREAIPHAMAASGGVPDDEPHPLLGPVEAAATPVASPSLLSDEGAPASVVTKERFTPRHNATSSTADQLFASRARDAASRPKTPGLPFFAAPRSEHSGAPAIAEARAAKVTVNTAEGLEAASAPSVTPLEHAPAATSDESAVVEEGIEAATGSAASLTVADAAESQDAVPPTAPMEPSGAMSPAEALSFAPEVVQGARPEEVFDAGRTRDLAAREPSPFLQEFQVAFGLLTRIMPIGFWLSRPDALLFAEEALPAFFEGQTLDATALQMALREKGPIPLEIIDVFLEELRRYKFSFVLEFV